MMNDLIICKTVIDGTELTAAAYYKEMELTMLRLSPCGEELPPGTIAIGKAETLQKNIGSSYIRIGDQLYYVSGKTIRPGTELPVMVTKDAHGTKRACASTRLMLTGRACAVFGPDMRKEESNKEQENESGICGTVRYSKKLTAPQKNEIASYIKELPALPFDVMVRTNAVYSEKKEILEEIEGLSRKMEEILLKSKTRTVFSVLYRPLQSGADLIYDIRGARPDRIITDLPDVFQDLSDRVKEDSRLFSGLLKDRLVLYRDASVPITSVYNLNRDIKRLLDKKVYLRCGGYLVIEKTEAFVSIDVNTGKCVKGKKPEETYRLVNREAAVCAAKQIILRNLSGMILIDFINLRDEAHETELLQVMKKELRNDPYRSEAVDITKLGIMEIVRPRKGESLSEMIKKV